LIEKFFNYTDKAIGSITAVLMLLMMANVFLDVILRYFFNTGSIAFQEMEWHFFSVMFLLGISYALTSESHVRVDFIYDNLSKKKKAFINIIGTVFMLIPFSVLIVYGSYEFVYDAYDMNEISQDPGGLTHRWIIKAMIPFGFALLIISSLGYIYKNILILRKRS
jgi:TRAP-type mannitol/chloroaromatic compound transport system permease small subunit